MNPSNTPRLLDSNRRATLLTGLGVTAAVLVVVAIASSRPHDASGKVPLLPSPPPKVQPELVHAERFQVTQPFRHVWRAEQPWVNNGWLLVLSCDKALLQVRQTKMPVLYVGAETAQRVNTGQESGRVVVLVPGDFRLADAPIFFGGEALPEELRQPQVDAELAAARAAGATAPTAETIAKATVAGQTYATDYELRLRAIDFVEKFSPIEQDLIRGWRAPLVK